jgi:K+-transporting ATPase ATPase C chain
MLRKLRPALVLFVLLTLLTGILYPLAVTAIAQAAFPAQANGSLVERDGIPVGSVLIGQAFSSPGYFWSRPSETAGAPYTPFDGRTLTGSAGSNLGPLSRALVDRVQERVDALQAVDPGNPLRVPVDLVTASASGLDPHISVAAAYYQIPRVARQRGMDEAAVAALVEQFIEQPTFGLLGEARVNVLLLNLALDAIK